jgi:hypothetical protein
MYGFRLSFLSLAAGSFLAALPVSLVAQNPNGGAAATAPVGSTWAAMPDAPAPQLELAAVQSPQSAPGTAAQSSPQSPAPAGSGQNGAAQTTPSQGSSSSQSAAPLAAPRSKHEEAAEQLRQEEKQRVLGIVPTFNTTYVSDAASLSAGQKMSLAFRSAIDPFTFAAAFLVAGYHEGMDQNSGFGWGAEGLGKRAGAAYLDAFDGGMIGNGILPALLHQDPRYFRLGHGSFHHRLFYAIASSYICKHDNTGRWEPNYSNVGGNIIAGGISNLYYPSQNSGWGQTISNGFIVTTEGTVGGVFQEFWPDISRKILHRDPTHGLDAKAAAEDRAKQQGHESN